MAAFANTIDPRTGTPHVQTTIEAQAAQRSIWSNSPNGTRYCIQRGGTMRQVCVVVAGVVVAVVGWVDYCGTKPIAEQAADLVAHWEVAG